MRILAKVRFNSDFAYVLDFMPDLEYFRIGNNSIVGTDGMFLDCYYYGEPSGRFYAFAGRKFDLTMQDREVINCYGQWWDGVTKDVKKRFEDEEIISVTVQTLSRLKKCYCFSGLRAFKSKFDRITFKYSGNVYDYFEYGGLIKEKT